jgi:CubicO group peptidase (beta-lactamase class C family)
MKCLKPLLVLASLFFLGGNSMVNAQPNLDNSEMQTATNASLTAADLESFLDRIIPRQLEVNHIPGATIAVVKDGRVLLAKGYGFADLEKQMPVVANKTLFRTGSVAKLLTWTAVMQLVEQGKIDLDADINTYLETFKIPATYPQPITMKHLLTHTAGFEDKLIGYSRKTSEDLEPLGSFVAKRIPARIFPPGKVTAYSNYGTTLAGYIVESVSKTPYERYIQKNILEPLGMTRSDFQQPPKKFLSDIAHGYTYNDGNFRRGAYEIMQIVPAGALNSTASDMANFMISQLQGGVFAGKRILQTSTVIDIQQQHFTNDPRVSGMAYGFYQAKIRGQRVLLHHGETAFFRTLLAIIPEQKLGLYVAYNAAGGSSAHDALLDAILERYFADTTKPLKSAAMTVDPKRFVGQYLSTRAPRSTLEKVVQLFIPFYQPIMVRANNKTSLEIQIPAQKALDSVRYRPSSWQAVDATKFRRSDGKDTLVFSEKPSTVLFFDSKPPRGYVRLSWFDTLMFQPIIPLSSLLGFAIALILTFVFARTARTVLLETHRGAYWLTLLTSALALIFMIGLTTYLMLGFADLQAGIISPILIGLLTVGMMLVPLTLGAAVVSLVPQWTGGGLLRVGTTITAFAGVVLLTWMNYWNLLGFRF